MSKGIKDRGYHVSPFGPTSALYSPDTLLALWGKWILYLSASNENHLFSVFSLALPEPLTHFHTLSSSPHYPNAFPVSPPDSPWGNHLSPCLFFALLSGAHNLQLGTFQQPAACSLALPGVLAFPHRVLFPHLQTRPAFLVSFHHLSLILELSLVFWLPLHFWLFFFLS